MIITKELDKKFNKKYDYLRLLDVTYDAKQFSCVISFLYPQTINDINEADRKEIYEFLNDFLGLNANLTIKYKKSYLDEKLIKKAIFSFFKTNNLSLFSSLEENDITIKNELAIIVDLELPIEFNEYIEKNQIQNKLKEYLEKEFIGEFYINLNNSNKTIDQSLLGQRKLSLPKTNYQKVKRYEVLNPTVLLGREISPYPELIAEQKTIKTQVILAGKISNLNKKEFKSKKSKDKNITNNYYTFDLNDTTGTLPCIYFSSKSNEVKMNKLQNDMTYLLQGDIRENSYGKRTFYLRYINYCEFLPQFIEKTVQSKPTIKFELKDTFQNIFPKPYIQLQQEKLFKTVVYNDFIMQNDFVVFDVETTGLDAENCEIIELAACKVVKGVITETFQSLVKPQKSIPDLITKITGINNDMIKDAPNIDVVLADFILFSKDCILSGYNVNFDMKFINKAGQEFGYIFENRVEDTMAFAREKLFIGNYTLKNVAKHLGVSLKNAHRALNDSLATANVLLTLNISEKS